MIDFNDFISKVLEKEMAVPVSGEYSPLGLSGCIRKSWYNHSFPKKTNADKLRIYKISNMIFDFIVSLFSDSKDPQVELIEKNMIINLEKDSIKIKGKIPDLLLVKIGGIKWLIQIKPVRWLDRTTSPNSVHRDILHLYMNAFSVPRAILLYVEKNTLKTKHFEIDYMPEISLKIIARAKELDSHIQSKKIPEAEAKIKDNIRWQCGYCDYAEECDDEIQKKK